MKEAANREEHHLRLVGGLATGAEAVSSMKDEETTLLKEFVV
jgi:hypothetical protein